MANDNIKLDDLMEEVRKKKQSEANVEAVLDDGVFDFPDLPEIPVIQKELDLDTCLENAKRELASYRLTPEEQQTIREFVTFHVQTLQAWGDHPEVLRPHYNLLIHGGDKESIRAFAYAVMNVLDISREDSLIVTEKRLLNLLDGENRSRPRDINNLLPADLRVLLIEDCREKPSLNLDGNGSAREASKKKIENYENAWKAVFEASRTNEGLILLVGCNEDVYRSTLRPFAELSQRVCSHHIQIKPPTQEDLLEECLTELRDSSFTLTEDFEPTLQKYFFNTYRHSELRGQSFVADLIDRIYARYYSVRRDKMILDAGCVPEYDLLTYSAESILGKMEQLVGLEQVKTEFRNIYRMQIAGLADKNVRYHMMFTGNPGTGKTTVAKMAAELFHRMGIIKSNKLVVVKPSDLISEWVAGTGVKAMEAIRRAYNGVLFIDEAYGIAGMDRGDELLNILLQEMEANSHKLVVIFAGYTDEMRDLLKANPGLASRIGQQIHFDDYNQEELAQIFLQMCEKSGFKLDPSARDELDDCIAGLMTREFFGNAREVRNLLQDLKEAWSEDYYEAVKKDNNASAMVEKVFLPHHFAKIMPPKKEINIHDLIGLDVLKKKLEVFKRQAMYQKHLREKGFTDISNFSMHMIFTGNPGTGKTTVAKLIAEDLYTIGMLKTNHLVVAERKDLVSSRGDTAQKTADIIRKAVGGVLFVDEAYSLAGSRYGNNECIEVLLTAMEEHKSDTVFIFAGYVDEMQDFLASNPGIQSRIGYTFHFEDYTPEELTKIYDEKMKKTGFLVAEDALSKVRDIMEYFQDVKNFGNGRFVNHVIHQTISQRANRDFAKQYRDIRAEDVPAIKTLIETAPNSMCLYDPADVTQEHLRRTAMHELGHAVVMVCTDPQNIPESISVRQQAGSFGRVKPSGNQLYQTERNLFDRIATLLAGKNAEKLLFGSHSTGCSSDYDRAKRIAEDMIKRFAMTTYGATAKEVVAAADARSMEILTNNRDAMETICTILLEKKELSGTEFSEMLAVQADKNH